MSAVVSSIGELSAEWFQVFEAYSDGYLRVLNSLFPPVVARFVQLKPITWEKRASAEIQLLGCPVVKDTSKTVSSTAGEHILFSLYWSNPDEESSLYSGQCSSHMWVVFCVLLVQSQSHDDTTQLG